MQPAPYPLFLEHDGMDVDDVRRRPGHPIVAAAVLLAFATGLCGLGFIVSAADRTA